MSDDYILQSLIAYAECLEFYGHKERIQLRLQMGDLEAAVVFTDSAIESCEREVAESGNIPNSEVRLNLKNLLQFKEVVRDIETRRRSRRRQSITTEI